MGELSTTLLHNLTDRMAARLKADLDGIIAERASGTNLALAGTVDDGSNDPALQAALLGKANVCDLGAAGANLKTALASLLSQSRYTDLAQAISDYVISADGGAHASFAAYLDAAAARQIHPLAGEVFRAVGGLGENAFLLSDAIVGCFAPAYQVQIGKRVYTGADGALVDDTTDAGDADAADVTLFTADDHCLYVGFDHPFTGLIIGMSTLASADQVFVAQYWNGNAWATLTIVDTSIGLTRQGWISWTAPSDWAPWYKDGGATAFADNIPRYYIRLQRTANAMVTPPVASVITLVPSAVLNASGLHLGAVTQPPLAICEITGVDTIDVTQIVAVDTSRFVAPAIRLRALSPFAVNLTPTVAYVDQDGNDDAQAQGAWVTPAALDAVAVTLNGADTGAQEAREAGWAVTTAATGGIFAVEVAELRALSI